MNIGMALFLFFGGVLIGQSIQKYLNDKNTTTINIYPVRAVGTIAIWERVINKKDLEYILHTDGLSLIKNFEEGK